MVAVWKACAQFLRRCKTMKFHFKNIGPISEAELELGDLTIVAGQNNTGKTYLVYTLYGLSKWMTGSGSKAYLMKRAIDRALSIKMKDVATKLMEDGLCKPKLSRDMLNKDRQAVASTLGRAFSKSGIAEVFSSPRDEFEQASVEVSFESEFPSTPYREGLRYPNGVVLIEYEDENLTFSIKRLGKSHSHERMFIEETVLSCYTNFLLMGFPNPFILSAERFGISLFYKELDFNKNRLVEMLQKMSDEKAGTRFSPYIFIDKNASRYALPIRDNIDYTRDIPNITRGRNTLENGDLHNSVKKIMGGFYKSDKNDIRFVSIRRGKGRFDIPLHMASSSARGLSDLYFHLRYQVESNELLIIDEPESHLDTQNQIMLARMLSQFVRSGIKVLITTHSDYVLKEINNLIMLNSSFEGKEELIKKLKYKGCESLNPDSLRCYIAEEGQLTRCKVDKFGADLPMFDETIDSINKTSNELASRLNNTDEN